MGNSLRDRLRRIREMGKKASGDAVAETAAGESGGPGPGTGAKKAAGAGGPAAGWNAERIAEKKTAAGNGETGPGQGGLSPDPGTGALPASFGPGWGAAGFRTLRRDLFPDPGRSCPPLRFPPGGPPGAPSGAVPRDLSLLIPDLLRYASGGGGPPALEDLLFFDLETTGLSGGAGTVAFLAAFGRFVPMETGPGGMGSGEKESGRAGPGGARGAFRGMASGGEGESFRLRVTQYLLLDYPGEYDFLRALLPEWGPRGDGRLPLTVTYNGKSFDSQIVKTRCLMNGLDPPVFYHADLLHPCRRLWKRVLPNCSQAAVERGILGLDRDGDTPGALAPDIWFSFLRSGDVSALSGICDHNVKDITGLAALFFALADIAERPLEAGEARRCDAERLALCWRRAGGPWGPVLLRRAAERGFPRACRQLSMEAEWRRGDYREALAWTEKGLAAEGLGEGLREDLDRRRRRLSARLRRGAT